MEQKVIVLRFIKEEYFLLGHPVNVPAPDLNNCIGLHQAYIIWQEGTPSISYLEPGP